MTFKQTLKHVPVFLDENGQLPYCCLDFKWTPPSNKRNNRITKSGIITAAFNRVHTVCWRAKFGVTLFKRKIWSFWWLTYINLSNSYLDMRYQDNCNTMSSTSKGIYKMIRKYPCNFTKQLFASGSVDFIGYETKKRR